MRKTKIVCTLGPATDIGDTVFKLAEIGMNVARLNMSHDNHEKQLARINSVKEASKRLKRPISLLLDTKGPEIRTGVFENPINLVSGEHITLTTRNVSGSKKICPVSFSELAHEVQIGSRILIDDGLIELQVESILSDTDILCKIINGGKLSSRKGVNVPGISLSLPFISDRDLEDLRFGIENDVDFVAASFTRNADDIKLLRRKLEYLGGKNIKIIAKIENSEGIKNINEIINASDGIMVARGDLGVEIPLEDIPVMQKKLIKTAYGCGKHVITATQMLDSMVSCPRPTRAESTDVANAIYDGTSAIMLSGETAAGKYPLEAVRVMDTIARRTESDIDYIKRFNNRDIDNKFGVTSAISKATCSIAHDLGASAIIAVSKSGHTARMVAKFRPQVPIICATPSEKVFRQINMTWGVIPVLVENRNNTDELFEHVIRRVEAENLLKTGELAVITAGIPLGHPGNTNSLRVYTI